MASPTLPMWGMPEAPSPLSTRRSDVPLPSDFSLSRSSLATLSSQVPLPMTLTSCEDISSLHYCVVCLPRKTIKRGCCPTPRLSVVGDGDLLHRLALPRGAHLLHRVLEVVVGHDRFVEVLLRVLRLRVFRDVLLEHHRDRGVDEGGDVGAAEPLG